MHGEGANFIAYQRNFSDDFWQTVSIGTRRFLWGEVKRLAFLSITALDNVNYMMCIILLIDENVRLVEEPVNC